MLSFDYHPSYIKEADDLERRFPNFGEGLIAFKRLCEIQFHPQLPKQVIAPAKLHRRKQMEVCGLWKIELAVKGVKSNVSPRIWFAVRGSVIVFLCASTHADNYEDNEMDMIAESRAADVF